MHKHVALLLITCLVASNLILVFTVTPTVVQAQSKPAVPTFTVKLVDNSYNVPPTQTTDPYTGKTTTSEGYRIEKIDIEITIKNQNYPDGLMYNVRTKGHFEQEWREEYGIHTKPHPPQSGGQYTILSIPIKNEWPYDDDAQIDFQVEAMSGGFISDPEHAVPGFSSPIIFSGVTSGWSKTQTLTINKNINKITTEQPDNPGTPLDPDPQAGFSWVELVVITTIAVIIAVIATLFILRKQLTQKTVDAINKL